MMKHIISKRPFILPNKSFFHHHLHTATTNSQSPDIYISKSWNPYFNLAFEDWIFTSKPNTQNLFLYVNKPCVVIGNNQNPWVEVNLPLLAQQGGYFVRRRSGGGTVYHDEGNINFSVSMMRDDFTRQKHSQMIVDALQSIGVNAGINERYDVCIGNDKISGSAFKIAKGRAYHHGTLLIKSKLNELQGVLRSPVQGIESKGVSSVKSPVTNIADKYNNISIPLVMDSIIEQFSKLYNLAHANVQTISEQSDGPHRNHVSKMYDELISAKHLWMHTPSFTQNIRYNEQDIQFIVTHGQIHSTVEQYNSRVYGSLLPKTTELNNIINDATCAQAVQILTERAQAKRI